MNIEELVIKNAEWIRRKAHQYYKTYEDAEDLASETIYKCLSYGKNYDNSRSFKPWALTIMENTYITQYNRRKCVEIDRYGDYDQYTSSENTDQRASINRILSIVRDCAHKSKCIECVLLFAKGYNLAEISDMLQIPIGTVKSRISAGRKMIREAINA